VNSEATVVAMARIQQLEQEKAVLAGALDTAIELLDRNRGGFDYGEPNHDRWLQILEASYSLDALAQEYRQALAVKRRVEDKGILLKVLKPLAEPNDNVGLYATVDMLQRSLLADPEQPTEER
jgi:hypothetical protein